ncbi:MAG: hypothetical protein B6242_08490 [Anaerolineaceae bacterium 4572_78]|nr:MAG: hypothetical protein B6242_08490 [Anaerolineaceae bacterium 4572_78]
MNIFDVLIILAFIFGVGFCMYVGMFRQSLSLLNIWLSLLFSLWLARPIGMTLIKAFLYMEEEYTLETYGFVLSLATLITIGEIIIALLMAPEGQRLGESAGMDIHEVIDNIEAEDNKELWDLPSFVMGIFTTLIWLGVGLSTFKYLLLALPEYSALSSLQYYFPRAGLMPMLSFIFKGVLFTVKFLVPSRLPGLLGYIFS